MRDTEKSKLHFESPRELIEEAQKYFDWSDRNPWTRNELVKYQGGFEEAGVAIGRPYSMDGFTLWLGVSAPYFRSVRDRYKEAIEAGTATSVQVKICDAIDYIETHINTQQYEGAVVGVFNASIIAKKLGLSEHIHATGALETQIRISVRDQDTADDLQKLDALL